MSNSKRGTTSGMYTFLYFLVFSCFIGLFCFVQSISFCLIILPLHRGRDETLAYFVARNSSRLTVPSTLALGSLTHIYTASSQYLLAQVYGMQSVDNSTPTRVCTDSRRTGRVAGNSIVIIKPGDWSKQGIVVFKSWTWSFKIWRTMTLNILEDYKV